MLNRSARSVVEALERRTLLSATLSGTTLNVTGTSGADTFTLSGNGTTITVVQGSTTSTFADSKVSKIVVNPSAGGDTVNLQSNTKPVSITGGGLDTVNIGDNGTLQEITAAVTITNPSSFTALNLNGSADSFDGDSGGKVLSGTLSASSISFSPGAINYTASQLSALTISTSYVMTVNGTGTLHGGTSTILNTGGNDDPAQTVTVLGTTGPLTINGSDDEGNEVFIGAGSIQGIHGAVLVNNDPLTGTSLFFDDSADLTGRTGSIAGSAPAQVFAVTESGLSPAPVSFANCVADSSLEFTAGQGNDNITISNGSASDEGETINGGGGNDTIIASNYGGFPLSVFGDAGNDTFITNGTPQGSTFDGGSGTNQFTFDLSAYTDAGNVELSDFGVNSENFDGASLAPGTVSQVNILLGPGNDVVTTDPGWTIPLKIHGGAGNDSIQGGSGNDTLFGDAGDDTLIAGSGNDNLNGGQGTDSLVGGDGIDTLDGGDGQPIQIIADDAASAPVNGSEGVTLTGNWISSVSNSGFYGTDYLTDNNSLKGSKSVKFTPSIPTTGSYQVYARWTASTNRATNVPFTVSHQGTNSTVVENQQINNDTWVLLGTYTLSADTGSSVTISNTGTNGYVIADAVRFVPATAAASISGTVFNDVNGNGARDAGEPGLQNRVVYIDSNKDGILDNNEPSTITDAAGYWQFTGLSAGTYRIREQNVAGVRHTDPNASTNYYDATVVTGPTASAISGVLFGEQEMTTSPAPVLAINAGGPAFTLNSGFIYAADTGFTGGTATNSAFEVANTDNDPIYYAYRSGTSFSYSLSVPNGNYSLVLNFVDPTSTAAGQRKFNVTVEGKQVLTNFDIFAATGSKTAVSKAFNVTVTGGKLTLSLKSVVGNAILSGFVLYPS
jgi:Ca2+-binding RTX toxin-like protein